MKVSPCRSLESEQHGVGLVSNIKGMFRRGADRKKEKLKLELEGTFFATFPDYGLTTYMANTRECFKADSYDERDDDDSTTFVKLKESAPIIEMFPQLFPSHGICLRHDGNIVMSFPLPSESLVIDTRKSDLLSAVVKACRAELFYEQNGDFSPPREQELSDYTNNIPIHRLLLRNYLKSRIKTVSCGNSEVAQPGLPAPFNIMRDYHPMMLYDMIGESNSNYGSQDDPLRQASLVNENSAGFVPGGYSWNIVGFPGHPAEHSARRSPLEFVCDANIGCNVCDACCKSRPASTSVHGAVKANAMGPSAKSLTEVATKSGPSVHDAIKAKSLTEVASCASCSMEKCRTPPPTRPTYACRDAIDACFEISVKDWDAIYEKNGGWPAVTEPFDATLFKEIKKDADEAIMAHRIMAKQFIHYLGPSYLYHCNVKTQTLFAGFGTMAMVSSNKLDCTVRHSPTIMSDCCGYTA